MKIAVMAGTPVDTLLGVKVLRDRGYNDILEVPISKNPIEQTIFQTSSIEKREKIISAHLYELEEKNYDYLFVYCNSLSGAVDFNKLLKNYNLKIITPMIIYEKLASSYNNIVVLSANAQGLAGIENVMINVNKNIKIIGITILELVEDIEKNIKSSILSEKFQIEKLANYLGSINGLEAIILGCTHFPYIKKELSRHLNISIIDPTEDMIKEIRRG